jgi:exodeoxyribonuclease-3
MCLCLQETKVQDADFPKEPLQALGYHVYYRGEKSYNGVALLCREKPVAWGAGLEDAPADPARLVWARFAGWSLVNTYVPQGREIEHPMYRYKIEWFARLKLFFETHFKPDEQVLWVGDLNVARLPEDVYNPEDRGNHVCYHKEVRRAFEDCLAWGFNDVYREVHPEPGRFTFFDYRTLQAVQKGLGWRIDYLLATKPLAARVIASEIDVAPRLLTKASDHCPLWAEFKS